MTTALIAFLAAALGVGVGLAIVSLDLLPTGGEEPPVGTPASTVGCTDGEEPETLRIAAAPEIASALEDLATQAAEMEESLRCANVEVVATPPAAIRAALSRGWVEDTDGPPPHVWIPTTTTEVELARTTSSVQEMLGDDLPSIARSPQVIAMPQPMAEALGWPDADLTWNAVAKLTGADDAWADRGQDDWGPFKLSFVEGIESQPSIDAVASLIRAVGAVPSGSDSEEASSEEFEARAQLLLLERKVSYIGENTQEQLDVLHQAEEEGELVQTVSALPLTEQQTWEFNRDADDTPLVAWYPDDGGPDADYPYATLNASWSNEATDVAARGFLDLLQSPEGRQQLQEAGFRDESRQSTPELSEQDVIRPDKAPPAPEPINVALTAPLLQAWRGLSQTGNILTVLDVSGSMATEVPGTGATRLELSVQGSIAGLQLFDPNTIAGLWEFSTEIGPGGQDHRELIPLGELDEEIDGVPAREATIGALQSLEPETDTGLYDTIAAGYAHMQENYQPDRLNALVVFTDGRNDDDDGMTLPELQDELREMVDPERPIFVLAVGYGPEADFEALNAVTTITDGKLYPLDRPEDIRNVFIDVQTGGVRGGTQR
jgi:Ca-activated chloride channel family protein